MAQYEIDCARAIEGKLVRFVNEQDGGPVHRVDAVSPDGMVWLDDMEGWFASHLFVVADDIVDRPPRGITHPTGSEEFAAGLDRLGVPAPWRLCDEEVGEVLAANGAIACNADTIGNLSEEDATQVALQIVLAINTLAGFKAVLP